MGEDKSLIPYRNKPHALYCFELMKKYCEKVYLSVHSKTNIQLLNVPYITDSIQNAGPIAGILAAMDLHSNAAWFVLACDFPQIEDKTIATLVSHRDPDRSATAYGTGTLRKPEPLCCIYEPVMKSALQAAIALGNTSPQKVLMESNVHLLEPQNPETLLNANEPVDRDQAKSCLNTFLKN